MSRAARQHHVRRVRHRRPVTLESFSARGKFLRQYTTQVWAADSSGRHPYDTPNGYAADASWQVDVP